MKKGGFDKMPKKDDDDEFEIIESDMICETVESRGTKA